MEDGLGGYGLPWAMPGCCPPRVSRPAMLMPTCGSLCRGRELTSSPKKAPECLDMMAMLRLLRSDLVE